MSQDVDVARDLLSEHSYRTNASEPSENAVLGAALLSPEATATVVREVGEDWFRSPKNQTIFRAIKSAYNADLEVDLTIIWERLKGSDGEGGTVDLAYLSGLDLWVGSLDRLDSYIKDLREIVVRRRVAKMCLEAIKKSSDSSKPAIELVHELQSDLLGIEGSAVRDAAWISLNEQVEDVVDSALERRRGELVGVGSGIKLLDRLTGGAQPGTLTIVGGRPSHGKTSLGLQWAINAGRVHGTAAFISLEMSSEELAMRAVSAPSGIGVPYLKAGGLGETQKKLLVEATKKLADARVWIEDTPGLTVDDIESRCRIIQRNEGLSSIFVDYMGLIQPSLGGDNLVAQMTDISRRLTGMAKRFNVPVIALSQLSRKVEGRDDKRPMASDVRDSGSIEQDAYLMIFVYRQDIYERDNPSVQGLAELIVAKNRGGPVGRVPCKFDGVRSQFIEIDSRYKEQEMQ